MNSSIWAGVGSMPRSDEPLVGDALGSADLHGGQGGDPDRSAQLLRRVDRARGLPAVVLGNRAQAGGIVDGEDDPEPQPLQQEAGHKRAHVLLAHRRGERDARSGQDEIAEHERRATAHLVERPACERARQDDRDRCRDQRDACNLGAHADHEQQEEGHEEAEPELDHPGEELAEVRRQEVQVAEEPELEQRRLHTQLDHHEGHEQQHGRRAAAPTVERAPQPSACPWLSPKTSAAMPRPNVTVPG